MNLRLTDGDYVCNISVATDIFDAELNDLRKKRWTRAFSGEEKEDSVCSDLRATIVIERKRPPGPVPW